MTQVAILWHMHQPFYEDLLTTEHVLPWARLHSLKDYYGMAALLDEFPDIHLTFNLVPSLLVQVQAFAANQAHDRYLELGLKPAADLNEADATFIVANFFDAQRQHMIDVYSRYSELLARRGVPVPPGSHEATALVSRFSVDDLRDLQVWQKLAWMDPDWLQRDERLRQLVKKGRLFSEADKALLRTVELELLNQVIPQYRKLAARGQVELSTSPFYHPILPLLCDTDVYLRNNPNSRMPRQRFAHPEDAIEQLTRAVNYHTRLFGERPSGLWPSEGSVSEQAIPIIARAGFKWIATDEQILAKSLGVALSRGPAGHLEQPETLYCPYTLPAGESTIACLFRDHVISDLIGFTYAGWQAASAADDFIGRLVEGGRRFTARTKEEATIAVILDGENAWEHFEGGGRPFLRALYQRLSDHSELRTVTMAQACSGQRRDLKSLYPGSWIDANFYTWVGHADDQRAWSQLAEARQALTAAERVVDQSTRDRAYEELLIGEGSDWFWWYGDDHSSAHDLVFDDLFRRHVRNAYELLGRWIPEELFTSNITTGAASPHQTDPTGFITPELDGEETTYFEWLGAGTLELYQVLGAMHETDQKPYLLTGARFGFDRQRLYIRLDATCPLTEALDQGFQFSIRFLEPKPLRFLVRASAHQVGGLFSERPAENGQWVDRGALGARVAAGTLIELSLPLDALHASKGDPVAFVIVVYDGAGQEVERHPAHRPLRFRVPDDQFEARNWSA